VPTVKGVTKHELWVGVACTVLCVLNALWLLNLKRSMSPDLRSSSLYATYLQFRSLLLKPLSLMIVFSVLLFWSFDFFRTRKHRGTELDDSRDDTWHDIWFGDDRAI
jgi:hypothetical protein